MFFLSFVLGAQNNRFIETVLSSTHILNRQYLFKTVSISILMLQYAPHLQPNFKISAFGMCDLITLNFLRNV